MEYWNIGGTYNINFKTRLKHALNQIGACDVFVMYTQGINDKLAETDAILWKIATKERFNYIRTLLPNAKIAVTLIESPIIVAPCYNKQILEVENGLENIFSISTQRLDFDGSYHWKYNGMKTITKKC